MKRKTNVNFSRGCGALIAHNIEQRQNGAILVLVFIFRFVFISFVYDTKSYISNARIDHNNWDIKQ